MMMRRARSCLIAVLAGMGVAGCVAPAVLRMKPVIEPKDETTVSPQLKDKKYAKFMVIPPSGTVRGEFDHLINFFEREFLKRQITVISSAVTGRVLVESAGGGTEKDTGARQLSDAERALVMAKKTGADALLQIGTFTWSNQNVPCRFFVLNETLAAQEFREVPQEEYQSWNGPKMVFSSSVLTFVGRLTDVESGEVMASFSYTCPVAWDLPGEYRAQIEIGDFGPMIVHENYRFSDPSWLPPAQDRVVQKVIGQVARKVLGQ